ncbi:peptidase P60 [Prosthecomicrobium hirschii]|uniref:Peptidase P60 n=1 Tax=Prosthecodimorpha hirschii TaxID=665126 RepID=A0A0P6WDF9_9HYPH|nr:NlpC/P60 family protein [Prosthecomicrobium hirschii]KPL54524.1 peptidase P60 [Prosthecomicrobium hirschii]
MAVVQRQRIVAVARSWIGTPYRHQASLKGVGADCLGLIRGVWREVIGPEPEAPPAYARDWAEAGGREAFAEAAARHLEPVDATAMRAGDVILIRWRPHLPAKHAGILTGPDAFLHAYEGAAVVESPLGPWWRRHVAHVFAFPGATD